MRPFTPNGDQDIQGGNNFSEMQRQNRSQTSYSPLSHNNPSLVRYDLTKESNNQKQYVPNPQQSQQQYGRQMQQQSHYNPFIQTYGDPTTISTSTIPQNTSQSQPMTNNQLDPNGTSQNRQNTDQSKSPRNDQTTSLPRSQSGAVNNVNQNSMETYFLTGWGNSSHGQLSAQNFTKNAIQQRFQFDYLAFGNKIMNASAGENHTMIIDHKQELYGCGSNAYGQIGIEGISFLTRPAPVPNLRDKKIQSVYCGSDHTFALTTGGEVYAWGLNLKGQLGIGDFQNRERPVLVYSLLPYGSKYYLARTDNKSAAAAAAAGRSNKQDDRTGDSESGKGLDERSNSIDNLLEQLKAIKRNTEKNMVLQTTLNNQGATITGKLVFGDSDIQTSLVLDNDEVVKQIACGSLHTVVLTSKNRVFSAGYGETYALGHGDQVSHTSFECISSLLRIKRMGASVQQQQQQRGSNNQDSNSKNSEIIFEKIERISCGVSHTVCVTASGRAFIWGISGMRDSLVFTHPTEIDLFSGAGPVISSSNTNNNNSNYHCTSGVIVDAQAGECMTLLLNSKGEVFTLGENTEGQLCSEFTAPNEYPTRIGSLPCIGQIAVGKNYCIVVQRDLKYLIGWGANAYGQVTGRLTSNAQLTSAVKIYTNRAGSEIKELRVICGSYHTILLSGKHLSSNDFVLKENEAALSSKDLKVDSQDEILNKELKQTQQQIDKNLEKLSEEVNEKQNQIEALKKCNVDLVKKQERHAKDVKEFKIREQEFAKQLKDAKFRQDQLLAATAAIKQGNNPNAVMEMQMLLQGNSNYQMQQSLMLQQQQQQQLMQAKNSQQKFQIKGVEKFKNVDYRSFNSTLDIDYNELLLEQKISEGGYGIIHRAKWRETVVAVKKFKVVHDENSVKDFLSECHAMESLRHPNIVMFLGACTKSPNFCIILEFCEKGSLWSLLQSGQKLTWEDRRRIALDIAKGVHYLHSSNPPILHRDLKSLNLLLDDNLRCKLADFGWTKVLSQDNYMTPKIGTYQWMAPEVINSNKYTEKADVFSYGIILWEIASREPPYKTIPGQTVSVEVAKNQLRPIIQKNFPIPFVELMQRCWSQDPNQRPSFKEIIRDLDQMLLPKQI